MLSEVDARGVFSLYLADEVFDGVLIFCGVRWTPLCEDRIFYLSDVAIEDLFLCGVGVPVSIPGLDPSGAGSSLLFNLGFITHGDVLYLG